MKTESEAECACKKAGFVGHCQCQYPGWLQHENKHYSCDFCGKNPVEKELIIHTMPWAICRPCWDLHHHAIALVHARGEEE